MAEGLQHAGEFKIDMCELITSTGMRIDLKTTVMGLTLFEDISSLTVSGTIVVADAVNMVSHGPILGQEYLYLKIHTPSFTATGDGVIDFSKNKRILGVVNYILIGKTKVRNIEFFLKPKKQVCGLHSIRIMLIGIFQTKKKF